MRIIDRFDLYMEHSHLNDNRVTVALKLSNGVIGKSRKEGRDLSPKVVELIENYYRDLDGEWLRTGKGEMLKTIDSVDEEGVTIPPALVQMFNNLTESARIQEENISRLTAIVDRLTGSIPQKGVAG